MMSIREHAIALLERREHSQLELKKKLLNKGYKLTKVEALITLLAIEGLQSDERYTEVYVRQRITAGFGPHRILAELKHRGISDSLVYRYLPYDKPFWWEVLSQLCKRKYREQHLNLTKKNSARLARFLMQRGFDLEHIHQWIQKCHIT